MTKAAIITSAGADSANSAQQAGLKLDLTHIAVGVARWTPDEAATSLKAEFARFDIASWEDTGTAAKRLQGALTNVRGGSFVLTPDSVELIPANADNKVSAVTVKSSDGATTYTQGTDYTVDSVRGEITRMGSGGIASGATVRVTFNAWDVTQVEAPYTFTPESIILPIPLPRAVDVVVKSPDGNITYEAGADYIVDTRLSTLTREATGSIPSGASLRVDYNYDTPINEIGVFADDGTLFSVYATTERLTYKSSVVPALPVGFYLQLTGLPVESIDITIGASPISLNTVEASLFGLYNLSIQRLSWQLAASQTLANQGLYI